MLRMQRPPLLEVDEFCFWKTCFETYIKSTDIDLWQIIQNSDSYFEIEDSETKMMKETPYELLKDEKKQQLGKNNEFSISNEETIDSGFTRFNAIVTSLKSLDQDYSSKYDMSKFLCALPLKWRAKVTAIEEAMELATLPFDELVDNLKVYEMILENDDVVSKTTTKEEVNPSALKAEVTKQQTSDNSDSQGGSDEDVDEEEAEAFNLMPRNFRKGNRFGRDNQFSNGANRFKKGLGNNFGNKGGKSSRQKGFCYNFDVEGHFSSECTKPKENITFFERAWSDNEDSDELQNDTTCLMAIDSQESNLKGKVISGGNITHDSITITNVEHVSDLAFNLISLGDNSKKFFYVASMVDNSTLWHRRLGHANMRLVQNLTSNELVRNLLKLNFERHFCDMCGLGSQGYSQTSKAYIVINKEIMRIEEYLNVTFDESLPNPKSSPSVENDRINEPIVQDLNGSLLLQFNISDEGYPKSVKEAKDHPIEQVNGELNERTLRSKTKQA
ncbi:retrovirus-related pol polyprotein from transposon TNT 1-94 [Tanacetum coccineum]|uniref:Retrovirus-related pol polyprotein from transposon TNT 1-94 n=1 Tax=Tanacetum coccineum TaxID=301880 RepID=A0ABQ4Z4A4_9ASTR